MSKAKHVCEKRGRANCEVCIGWRVKLWDAINEYVKTCGGSPSRYVGGNTRRMNSVVEIERVICDAAEHDRIRS